MQVRLLPGVPDTIMSTLNMPTPKRNYFITIGSIILCAIFAWFAVMIWFVEFAEDVPFEPVIRVIVCAAFGTIAVLLARTARRGYAKRRLRELLLELLSGGF